MKGLLKKSSAEEDTLPPLRRNRIRNATADDVKEHASGKDEVSRFNRELNGFHIYARYPEQARRMHAALRALDAAMPERRLHDAPISKRNRDLSRLY